jgi:phosphate transport system substrate-binding protein
MKSPTTSVSATSAWSSLTVTDAEVAAYVGHDIEVGYSPLGPGGRRHRGDHEPAVDFGASDAPLTTHQFSVRKGCVQIPWGPVGDVDSVPPERCASPPSADGQVIADIFMRKLTRWNHPCIERLNPGVTLPALEITPFTAPIAPGRRSTSTWSRW